MPSVRVTRQLALCVQALADPSRGLTRQRCWPSSGVRVCVCVCSACSPFQLCFSLPGSMIERILVSCSNQQDLHEWVDHLQKQTKVTSAGNPTIKPHSVPSHTVRAPVPLPPPDSGVSLGFGCQQVIKCFKAQSASGSGKHMCVVFLCKHLLIASGW